jgi:ring-1,2-phenylacetyl-CoA epoxidase subunit PaaD
VSSDTAHAWAVLQQVPDPEVPVLSVCDLGHGARGGGARTGRMEVTLTPTYSGCPATEVIEQSVRDALAAAGFGPVTLNHRLAPAWTTDWISDEGRRKLRDHGIAPPSGRAAANDAVPASGCTHAASTARAAAARTPSGCRPSAPRPARRCTAAWTAANPSNISSRYERPALPPLARARGAQPDTDDAVVLSFDVPEALRDTFRFQPGQYLTLRRPIGGEGDLRRSYSICAAPGEALRVGVRRVPGGAFSTWLHQTLKAGDTLDVMEPQGRFGAALAGSRRRGATCCASPAAAASRRCCPSSRPRWPPTPAAA